MKRLFLSLLAFAAVSSLLAQAVQPSLMVFPSRAWCHQNGFEKVVVKAISGVKLIVALAEDK
mgnify:CR=1 FL=1